MTVEEAIDELDRLRQLGFGSSKVVTLVDVHGFRELEEVYSVEYDPKKDLVIVRA